MAVLSRSFSSLSQEQTERIMKNKTQSTSNLKIFTADMKEMPSGE